MSVPFLGLALPFFPGDKVARAKQPSHKEGSGAFPCCLLIYEVLYILHFLY